MRLAFLTLFTALLGLAAVAQNASPTLGCAPLEVDFSPPDGGQAFWNFGDGSSSPLSSPAHVYTGPGVYTVTFSRTNGGPVVGSVVVTVYPKPTVTLTMDEPEGCVPHRVEFEVTTDLDPAISIDNINWAFGNGQSGNGASTSSTYTTGGLYDVSVEIETSLSTCNTTVIFADTVIANALPTTNFTASPDQSCDVPLVVQLNNTTTGVEPLSYTWDFGNGQTSTDEDPAPITFNVAGDYAISLIVTDSNGCEGIRTRPISAGPPSPDFNLPDTVCFGQQYPVSAFGAANTYTWTFGPNITVVEDQGSTQLIVFTLAGNTTIGLAVENTDDGCASDTTRTLFVQQLIPDATSDPSYHCESPYSINYSVNNPDVAVEWRFPGGQGQSSALDTTITYTYDEGGEYGQNWAEQVRALLTITSPQGCMASTLVVDTIDVPNALFIPDNHYGCAPLLVTFADSIRSNRPVTQVTIDWGDGSVEAVATTGPWTHTYTTPGEYEPFLSIQNSLGCVDTSYSIPIQVGELIGNLTYTSDASPACPGDTLTFINTTSDPRIDNVHFEVEGGSSFHCANNDTLFHVITNTIEGNGLDLRLYVEYNGCIDSISEAFPYASAPLAQLNYLIECETPYDIRFYNENTRSTADSLYVYAEAPGTFRDSFAITDSLDLTLTDRGVYQAIIVAIDPTSPCGSNRDTVEFYITEPIAVFNLDELFCSGATLPLDGSLSQDVNATCSKGYQWEFTWDRPYTSSRSSTGSDVLTGARGDQTVSLIVEDINGCTDTTSQDIRVFQTNLSITATSSTICLPATVGFTLNVDTDTTIVSYDWDFGGYGTSTDPNPTFTFPNDPDAGSEIIVTCMTNDELNCPGLAEFVLNVYRPISNVTIEDPVVCLGTDIVFSASNFTDQGNDLTFMWDFGNGFTSQNAVQTVSYTAAGSYNVNLTYTETNTFCSVDTTLVVRVEEPANSNFTSDIDGQPVVCFPQIINFTDNSTSAVPYTPIWSVANQLAVGPSFTASLDRGTSEVSLITITSGAGCSDTITRSFTLVGPEGGFTFEPGVICEGETVEFMLRDTVDVESWTWDFGNGTTEDNTNPTTAIYDFRPTGDQTVVSLTLRSDGGQCSFTVTDTLRFLDIEANFTTDIGSDFACDPTVMFIDQSIGAGTYLYDFGNGDTSTEPSPTYTFPAPGEYEVTLRIEGSTGQCVDSTTRTITVLEPLNLQASVDSICAGEFGDVIIATSRPVVSVVFDPQGFFVNVLDSLFRTVQPLDASTNFAVTVSDSFGCEDEILDLAFFVSEAFTGEGDTLVIFAGDEVTFGVDEIDGFSFSWNEPDVDGGSLTVSPEMTRDYVLTVTSDVDGCANAVEIIFRVIVAEEPVVPNLFSPNSDGTNDDWGPLFPEGITPTVEIYQVYNRWGALVFESEDPNEKWQGDANGNGEAPSDVYAYVIQFVYPNGREFKSSGEVTLLR